MATATKLRRKRVFPLENVGPSVESEDFVPQDEIRIGFMTEFILIKLSFNSL